MLDNLPSPTGGDTNGSTPPLLDSTFFPHIMDRILRYAPYRSLLVLRATSKTFKKRVDALLMDHVMIKPWGAYRNEESINQIFLTKNELRRLPELQNGLSALKHIRVVDMVAIFHDRLLFAEPITPLRTTVVRTKVNHWFSFEHADVEAVHVHFLLDSTTSREYGGLMEVDVPRSVVQVVINIEHDCIDLVKNPGDELGIVTSGNASRLEHLVFICNPHRPNGAAATPARRRCVAADHAPRKFERTFVDFVGITATQYWTAAACKLTLVGFPLECIAPKLFADSLPPSKEDVRLEFNKLISEIYTDKRRFSVFPVADIEKCIEQTDILDHDTYRRRVGEEAYRLQTVW